VEDIPAGGKHIMYGNIKVEDSERGRYVWTKIRQRCLRQIEGDPVADFLEPLNL